MTFNSAVAQSRHGACVVLLCLSALFSSQTPAADTPPARARTEPQPYSVSAVAYAGLPERLASRARKGDVNTGPSAQELRGIFLQAVDTAIMRSPKVKGSKAQQQASRSDIDEARAHALRFLQADHWEVAEEKDAYLPTPAQIDGLGPEELSNYQAAQSEGSHATFYYWHRSE